MRLAVLMVLLLAGLAHGIDLGKDLLAYVEREFGDDARARLTAWEMVQEGIPCTLITDNMAGHFMAKGEIDAVVVGADRVAKNGDVANKIGTYMVAVLAKYHEIPFYVASPLSTIDVETETGEQVVIEERDEGEVVGYQEIRWAPKGVAVSNPAFDVTPAKFISALITEKGVIRDPEAGKIKAALSSRS